MDGTTVQSRSVRQRARGQRASRSRSAIDSRDVEDALRRRRLTRAEKRERNKTQVVSPKNQHGASAPSWLREAEMRQEIMKLQKIHIKELQAEMKSLREENRILVQSLASREQELSQARLECEMLSRDLEEVQNSHHGQLNVGHIMEDHIAQVEEERDSALAKLRNVLSLVEALSTTSDIQASQDDLRDAVAQRDHEQQFAAFQRLNDRLRRTEQQVQEQVQASNQQLDEYLDNDSSRLEALPSDDSALDQLLQLRQRLRPKLRTLVKSSNSLLVRSSASSQSSSHAASLSASLNSSSSHLLPASPYSQRPATSPAPLLAYSRDSYSGNGSRMGSRCTTPLDP
eukprot:TRINITY_DN9971_c0_g2_i6.p1 TRINITY_DN9971_c0_g2~~TRINITY_DN9971_c0_g2_i6.p1  ORF type:complete len:343 (+),score=59.10 TRINITY_DN9971_c0_g2_i6:61-1089(+)